MSGQTDTTVRVGETVDPVSGYGPTLAELEAEDADYAATAPDLFRPSTDDDLFPSWGEDGGLR